MAPAFAAVGAGIAALLESTIASRYQIAGAQLQIVLLFGIAITLVYGFEEGMAWAFVGGLFLDFLAMRPHGIHDLRALDRDGRDGSGGAATFAIPVRRSHRSRARADTRVSADIQRGHGIIAPTCATDPADGARRGRDRQRSRGRAGRTGGDRTQDGAPNSGSGWCGGGDAVSAKVEGRQPEPRNIYRFGAFVLAVVVGVTSLSGRMFYLQVIQARPQTAAANAQSTAKQTVPSTRGLIFDATGAPLVKNVVSYSVTVTPSDLSLSEKPVVAERLGSLLSANAVDIETRIDSATGSLFEPVKIADNVPVEVARFIEENGDSLPGVKVVVINHRQYSTGPLFAEILGYTGQITQPQYDEPEEPGLLEFGRGRPERPGGVLRAGLRGTYGDETVALDDSGKPIPGLVTSHKPPIPGDSLTLTIDSHEQQIAQKALQWGLNGSSVPIATRGVIIVENPQNGNILAMVSLPSYDDQIFADGISETDFQKLLADPSQPLLNKAIAAQYAPGSTFKLVTGTAGLQDNPQCQFAGNIGRSDFNYCNSSFNDSSGAFNASTTLLSQPFIQIGEFKFWEWNKQGWGPLEHHPGRGLLERHVLLPARPNGRPRSPHLLGHAVRLRELRPASTSRSRPAASSRPTSGS